MTKIIFCGTLKRASTVQKRVRSTESYALVRPTLLMGTKNLYENGPNPFFFDTKYLVRVKLMATVLFRHGFDYLSKLVYAGEIQQSNCRKKIAT